MCHHVLLIQRDSVVTFLIRQTFVFWSLPSLGKPQDLPPVLATPVIIRIMEHLFEMGVSIEMRGHCQRLLLAWPLSLSFSCWSLLDSTSIQVSPLEMSEQWYRTSIPRASKIPTYIFDRNSCITEAIGFYDEKENYQCRYRLPSLSQIFSMIWLLFPLLVDHHHPFKRM